MLGWPRCLFKYTHCPSSPIGYGNDSEDNSDGGKYEMDEGKSQHLSREMEGFGAALEVQVLLSQWSGVRPLSTEWSSESMSVLPVRSSSLTISSCPFDKCFLKNYHQT